LSVKGEWDHRDITSNVIDYKHIQRFLRSDSDPIFP